MTAHSTPRASQQALAPAPEWLPATWAPGSEGAEVLREGYKRRAASPFADLSVVLEAVGISWRGRRLPLSGAEARIVAYVLDRGRASWEELNLVLGRERCSVSTLRVFLHRLRHKLVEAGAPDLIETVRGWGVVVRDDAGLASPGQAPIHRPQAVHAGL
jgi:DNA-binding response OmpR family regulator